jgi:hypothetical protein
MKNNWRQILSWEEKPLEYYHGMQLTVPTKGRKNKIITVNKAEKRRGMPAQWTDSGGNYIADIDYKYPKISWRFIIGALVDIAPDSIWKQIARAYGDPGLEDWDIMKRLDEFYDEKELKKFLQNIVNILPQNIKQKIKGTFLEEALKVEGVKL